MSARFVNMWIKRPLWIAAVFMLACSGSTPRDSVGVASAPEQSLPTVIQTRVTVPERGRVVLAHDVHVTLGGRLEIGPGAVLAFAKGKGLLIEGGALIASGTAAAPVILRSAASSPLPGDWSGLVFDVSSLFGESPPSIPSSVLEHVIVEHAGGGADRGLAAGISIRGCVMPPRKPVLSAEVVLRHVALRDNAVRGLDDLSECPVHWEDLSFGKNGGVSARVDIDLADLLGTAPSESVEITGGLRRSLTLPRLAAPYLVVGDIRVGGWSQPAVLTVPSKTVLRFSAGKGIMLGGKLGTGRLVAHGVTFTCGEGQPVPGCWTEVHFWVNASADLEDDIFEAGGGESGVIIAAAKDPSSLRITRCLFRDNASPAFGAPRSCARWNDPRLENKSIGQPLCKVLR